MTQPRVNKKKMNEKPSEREGEVVPWPHELC